MKRNQEIEIAETTRGHEPLILTETDARALEIEIDQVIQDVCQENNWEPNKIINGHWVYILGVISSRIFKLRPELIRQYNIKTKDYTGDIIIDNLYTVYYIYYNLCYRYNKIIGIDPFCRMVNISDSDIDNWSIYSGKIKVTNKHKLLKKIIQRDREQSLISVMVSSKDNPVKYIALGNHFYGWNMQRTKEPEPEKKILSISDLPRYEIEKKSDYLQIPDFSQDDE